MRWIGICLPCQVGCHCRCRVHYLNQLTTSRSYTNQIGEVTNHGAIVQSASQSADTIQVLLVPAKRVMNPSRRILKGRRERKSTAKIAKSRTNVNCKVSKEMLERYWNPPFLRDRKMQHATKHKPWAALQRDKASRNTTQHPPVPWQWASPKDMASRSVDFVSATYPSLWWRTLLAFLLREWGGPAIGFQWPSTQPTLLLRFSIARLPLCYEGAGVASLWGSRWVRSSGPRCHIPQGFFTPTVVGTKPSNLCSTETWHQRWIQK